MSASRQCKSVWLMLILFIEMIYFGEVSCETVSIDINTKEKEIIASSMSLSTIPFEVIQVTATRVTPSSTSTPHVSIEATTTMAVTTIQYIESDLYGGIVTTSHPFATPNASPVVETKPTTVDDITVSNPTTTTKDELFSDLPAGLLSLIAVVLSALSLCCMIITLFGCILTRCRKSCSNAQLKDDALRTATLQRPLGAAIRDSFPLMIENPMLKEATVPSVAEIEESFAATNKNNRKKHSLTTVR